MPRRFIALVLLALVATTGPVHAQSTTKPVASAPTSDYNPITRIGQVGGALLAIEVRGDLAYVAVGPRLRIMNVADPANPTIVGESAPFEGPIYDIAVVGDRAYIKMLDALAIINISDPSALTTLGSLNIAGTKVAVSGSFAFVSYNSRLYRINVSNPAAPVVAGSAALPRGANDLVTQGQYVYAAVIESGLSVIDGQTAGNPTVVGKYDPPGRVEAIAVSGNYVYLANIIASDPFGLRVIDVSTPSNPRLVASYDTPGTPYDVAVDGTYAYVADGNALLTIDITNPLQPTADSSLTTLATDVEVADGQAFLRNFPANAYKLDGTDGARIIDVSDPPNAAQVGTIEVEPFAFASDFAVTKGHTFVIADETLIVSSIVDPANPVVVARLAIEQAQTIIVVGRYAYITPNAFGDDPDGTVQIVDITTPSTPTIIGSFVIGAAQLVGVAGTNAYLLDRDNGCGLNPTYSDCLRTINVANPAAPVVVATAQNIGNFSAMTIGDRYAYALTDDSTKWFVVIDLVNPNQPKVIARRALSGGILSPKIVVSGSVVYIKSMRELITIDVASPTSPTIVNWKSIDYSSEYSIIEVDGSFLYVARNSAYEYVYIDIYTLSDKGIPTLATSYEASHDLFKIRTLRVYGKYIFFSDRTSGITTLRWPSMGPMRPDLTVQYDGWIGVSNPSALGKSYRSTVNGKVSLSIPATTSIDWITLRGPSQGMARITIDGVDKGIVDLYAPSKQYQSVITFGGLANTPHEIVITALGQKNPASSGTEVQLDAFRYGTTTVNDDDERVRYGNWTGVKQLAAAGGSYRAASVAGRVALFRFTGTAFTIVTARGPSLGKADIYVDGVLYQQVDLYLSGQNWQVPISIGPLDPGQHTVQFRATGTKNALSKGTSVVFDGYTTP